MTSSTAAIPDKDFMLLQRSIHNQRLQLELALETMPREVYSNALMEAMRREEMAMRDGVKITNESAKNIDDMLKNETAKFYRKISKENEKRWISLQQKVELEYTRFYQSSRSGSRGGQKVTSRTEATSTEPPSLGNAKDPNVGSSTDSRCVQPSGSIPTAKELDNEIVRLEEDYNKNWFQYEGENLRTAFRSQMDRVESEWSSHEQNLTEDYNRTKITEKIGHNRQKVAEKSPAQKRQFSANLDSLHAQKAASQRWMNRQSIRLTSQAKEIALERAKIGDLLGQELSRALSRSTI